MTKNGGLISVVLSLQHLGRCGVWSEPQLPHPNCIGAVVAKLGSVGRRACKQLGQPLQVRAHCTVAPEGAAHCRPPPAGRHAAASCPARAAMPGWTGAPQFGPWPRTHSRLALAQPSLAQPTPHHNEPLVLQLLLPPPFCSRPPTVLPAALYQAPEIKNVAGERGVEWCAVACSSSAPSVDC